MGRPIQIDLLKLQIIISSEKLVNMIQRGASFSRE